MTLRPAPPDTGVVFVHQRAGASSLLSASVRNLVRTELCTSLGSEGLVVKTVEHVLGALVDLGVDNVFIDLDAGEVPAMDGSAGPFVRLIKAAGLLPQDRPQPFLKILEPIEVCNGRRRILVEPAEATRVTYSIQYDHPLIQLQRYSYAWSASAFEREIADARTFGFLKEVQHLWSRGLGKGGSLENTIVLSDVDVLNESGLRFPDEFVRHKVLDLIGDLALIGIPIIGHFTAECAGHALHTRLIEAILAQPKAWKLVNVKQSPARVHGNRPFTYAPNPHASL